MSLINFKPGNAAVTITKLWTDFKAVVAEKSLLMQYEEDSNLYYIYTLDGETDYLCYIYKGSVPNGSSVYNQTQNDLDKTDWVNNYKATAGQKQFDVLHNSTIKAASTAAVASDTALVVAISPNNTIAATQSGTWNVGVTGTATVIVAPNVVDSNNSTTTTLLANQTFTGTSSDLLGYASVAYSLYCDVDSSTLGVIVQFSPDGTNWDDRVKNTYTYDGTVTDLIVRPHDRYYRIKYINGNTNQTVFRLQSILCKTGTLGDSIGIDHAPTSGDDAALVKAVLSGKTTAGGPAYVDVKVNPSGTLQFGGGQTPSDSYSNPTDGVNTIALSAGWNGTTWDRIRSNGSDSDGYATLSSGVLHVKSYLTGFNGTTWDRLRSSTTNGLVVDVSRVQSAIKLTSDSTNNASIINASPTTEYGLVVRNIPSGTQTISGSVTANIGTSGSLALDATLTGGTAKTKITDGTNTAAVKAANVQAVAADPSLVVQISPNNTPPVKIDNGAAQGMLIPGAISVNYNIATNCQAKFTSGTKAYNSTYTTCLISPGGGNVNWTYADGGTDTVTMIAGYPYCVKVSQINNSGTVVTDLQVFV